MVNSTKVKKLNKNDSYTLSKIKLDLLEKELLETINQVLIKYDAQLVVGFKTVDILVKQELPNQKVFNKKTVHSSVFRKAFSYDY